MDEEIRPDETTDEAAQGPLPEAFAGMTAEEPPPPAVPAAQPIQPAGPLPVAGMTAETPPGPSAPELPAVLDNLTVPNAAAPADAPASRGLSAGAILVAAALISLIIAASVGVASGYLGARLGGAGQAIKLQRVQVVPPTTDEPVVAAAAAAVPSVVNIDIRGGSEDPGSSVPSGHPGVPSVGNGSGVAYRTDGEGGTYIITNNHVVESGGSITVRDTLGQKYDGTLVGRDPETDIAVVRIDSELPAIKRADSTKLQVGQLAVAIGSPFGLAHSVTEGVISALGRSLPDFGGGSSQYPLVDAIQTDAAINPGNSGGALVDREGRLIGINTAIYSDSGSSGGVGFAIPSNAAVRVADQIVSKGKVDHPFLGIIGQTIDEEFAAEEDLTVDEGAYVVDLVAGGSAVKAGVKEGDVVVELDGEPIRSMDDLILQVRRKQIGDTVDVGIIRDGKRQTLQMKVGTKPAELPPVESEETTTP